MLQRGRLTVNYWIINHTIGQRPWYQKAWCEFHISPGVLLRMRKCGSSCGGVGAEGSKVNSVVVTTSFGLVSPIGGWKVGWSEGVLINLSRNFSTWQHHSCHDSLFKVLAPVWKKCDTCLFDALTLLIDYLVEASTQWTLREKAAAGTLIGPCVASLVVFHWGKGISDSSNDCS